MCDFDKAELEIEIRRIGPDYVKTNSMATGRNPYSHNVVAIHPCGQENIVNQGTKSSLIGWDKKQAMAWGREYCTRCDKK